MKKLLTLLWCLIPVALLAWHYGPGQGPSQRATVSGLAKEARAAHEAANYTEAVELYTQALSKLQENPEQQSEETVLRLELARANTRSYTGELDAALEEMEALLTRSRAQDLPKVEQATRAHLAEGHYHKAWLLRLEEAGQEDWLAEAESARQHFRLLAEGTAKTGADAAPRAEAYRKNLEAVIRLEQMDLSELAGLPLPEQANCNACKDGKGKKGKKKGKGKKPGEGEGEPKDARGAGSGRRPEGSGS